METLDIDGETYKEDVPEISLVGIDCIRLSRALFYFFQIFTNRSKYNFTSFFNTDNSDIDLRINQVLKRIFVLTMFQ